MNIREIVKKWLGDNGYDGLYEPGECGCELKDLMPCDEPGTGCEAGYKIGLTEDADYDFLIGPVKPGEEGA